LFLKSTTGSQSHAVADSGFGYSQVLPIIVRCLLAGEGDSILIEQPELHLNPALQVRLAEFFIAISRAGRQIVLETHSEHIVNALRVAAAEDPSGTIATSIAMYYVASGDRPKLHELHVQPDGTVPDWPTEFFGEALALSGRLLRAQRRFLQKTTR
jgi:predicted ATPase